MTKEDRLAIIRGKAEKDKQAQLDAKKAEDALRELLVKQIDDLTERIETVLVLANECLKNGVKIPEGKFSKYDSGKQYGYPYEFIAEGIYHHTGIIKCGDKFTHLGINNGGACGCYDFWTNGISTFSVHENRRNDIQPPRIKDMEKFLEEFDIFEKGFLNFIDSLA